MGSDSLANESDDPANHSAFPGISHSVNPPERLSMRPTVRLCLQLWMLMLKGMNMLSEQTITGIKKISVATQAPPIDMNPRNKNKRLVEDYSFNELWSIVNEPEAVLLKSKKQASKKEE